VVAAQDPDALLAELGTELAARVAAALPGWVLRCVDSSLPADTPDRDQVLARAEATGLRARREVEPRLMALLGSDVDNQGSTPLTVAREAVSYPTEVLRGARVPPVPRDPFVSARFPDDPYGLSPASLRAVDPDLGELSIAWGAAKAMAHRQRHGTPDEFT